MRRLSLALILWLASSAPSAALAGPPHGAALPSGQAHIAGHVIPVEIADTPDTRRKGLSDRDRLTPGTGLVLKWALPAVVRIWMPDMHFPLDIVFVAGDRVSRIVPDLPPCPSKDDCPTVGPDDPVSWVLELPAGSAAAWGLKTGQAALLKPGK